jgi:hypothetical protein
MIAVRDSETDLPLAEWALGALYGTYGNWGQKAYPSDRWIAQRLHIGRDKVRTAREGLIGKGLLENIGQAPNGQPNQLMYRLTLPVEVEGVDPDRATSQDAGRGVDLDRATVDLCGSTGGPMWVQGGPAVSPQELEELEVDLESSTVVNDQEPEGQEPDGPTAPGKDIPSGPSVDDLRTDFLAYVREHASQDSGVRPAHVFDALGVKPTAKAFVAIVGQLRDDGHILPCDGGWYPAPVAA